jgi:hypothetical protein
MATGSYLGGYVMLDITQETLIPLREAPLHLPARCNGKRLHISACYRWISRGVRGVVLESIQIGGTTYTSLEALQRFGDELTIARRTPGTREVTPRTRQREIDRARQLVDKQLGLSGRRVAGDVTVGIANECPRSGG